MQPQEHSKMYLPRDAEGVTCSDVQAERGLGRRGSIAVEGVAERNGPASRRILPAPIFKLHLQQHHVDVHFVFSRESRLKQTNHQMPVFIVNYHTDTEKVM
jgi:hypothetical protein